MLVPDGEQAYEATRGRAKRGRKIKGDLWSWMVRASLQVSKEEGLTAWLWLLPFGSTATNTASI